ncbi:putative lipase protein, partial [Fennellomyces sp. T-0311]
VVFVDYSLSPKVRYPVALEECYNSLSWIVDTDASIHHLDSTKIAVFGDSAGGNLAAALSILDKRRNGGKSRIQSQILFYPIVDANLNTESYKKFGKGCMLTTKDMEGCWDAYVPDKQVRFTHCTASPLVATIDELKDLPPALIYTAEVDVLRDEAEVYAVKLMQAGVPVLVTRVVGVIHGFLTLYPSLSIADEIYHQTVSYLQRKWDSNNLVL